MDNPQSTTDNNQLERALDNIARALQTVGSAVPTHPYKFSVYRAAAQNTAAGVWTKTAFDTKVFDTNNNFDVITNNRYTAPVSGYYDLKAFVRFNVAVTQIMDIALYKNGVAYKQGAAGFSTASSVTYYGLAVNDTVYLAAGDYVEIFTFANTTLEPLIVGAAFCFFSGHLSSRDGVISLNSISTSPWIAFTPTWTGITPGNGVSQCYYQQIGNTVFVRGQFTAGTTSSGTGVSPIMTLPVNANANYNMGNTPLGQFRYQASSLISGYVRINDTTHATLVTLAVSGANLVDANLSVALASTYVLNFNFNYEVA